MAAQALHPVTEVAWRCSECGAEGFIQATGEELVELLYERHGRVNGSCRPRFVVVDQGRVYVIEDIP
jgi:hypothetical protein